MACVSVRKQQTAGVSTVKNAAQTMGVAAVALAFSIYAFRLFSTCFFKLHWFHSCLASGFWGSLDTSSAASAQSKKLPKMNASSLHLPPEARDPASCSPALSDVQITNLLQVATELQVQILNLLEACGCCVNTRLELLVLCAELGTSTLKPADGRPSQLCVPHSSRYEKVVDSIGS